MDHQAEEKKDRKSNRTRQKNTRGDSKVESNDSPEIPDRGGDIRYPQPPFRVGDAEKEARQEMILFQLRSSQFNTTYCTVIHKGSVMATQNSSHHG